MHLLRIRQRLKQQDQIGPDYRRLTAAWVMVFLILCWGKLAIWFWVDVLAALLPLCVGFVVLAYLSPPVATALYFLGNYFFGNLSIAYYPRMSFLTVIAAVLLGTLLVVRWKRGELARFLALPKRVWLALAALALFFLLGFTRAVWEVHTLVADPGHSGSVLAAFKESLSGGMRGSNLLSHYMFLSHWLTFPSDRSAGVYVSGRFKGIFPLVLDFIRGPVAGYTSITSRSFPEIYAECRHWTRLRPGKPGAILVTWRRWQAVLP